MKVCRLQPVATLPHVLSVSVVLFAHKLQFAHLCKLVLLSNLTSKRTFSVVWVYGCLLVYMDMHVCAQIFLGLPGISKDFLRVPL